MTNIFSKKILCLRCKKRYKYKLEYGKPLYLCSTYSNKGREFCDRQAIFEEELIYLVKKHMYIMGIKEDVSISDYVDRIEKNGEEFTIYYSDKTSTVVSDSRIIY